MSVLKQIGEAIAKHRKNKGWSQGKLAQVLGVDRSYISSLESGSRNPSVLTLDKLARALDSTVHDFTYVSSPTKTKEQSYPIIPGHLMKQLPRWQGKQWYHQRFDGCPYLLHMIAEAEVRIGHEIKDGTDFSVHYCFFDDGKADWYILMDDIHRITELLLRRDSAISQWAKKFIQRWDPHEKKFYKLCEQIHSMDIRALSNESLISLHDEFLKTILERNSSSSTIDAFALGTDRLLTEQLRLRYDDSPRIKQKLTFADFFSKITAPTHLSFASKAELELLKLARNIKKDPGNKRSLIRDYQDHFFWIKNNYIDAHVISTDFIETELAQVESTGRNLDESIEAIETMPVKSIPEKKSLLKQLKLDRKILFLIETTEEFTHWQDERKRATLFTAHCATLLLEEIGRRVKRSSDDLKLLSPREVSNIFSKKPPQAEFLKRKKECVLYWDVDGHEVVSGKLVKKIYQTILPSQSISDVNDFRGMTASVGKAEGIVKIIKSVKEIHKIKRGDILVAVMTRPDYVPAMKLASAIVTDEGGITSHAAIVSRELGIPCVIGTKMATKILKDGDYVEVNANHGIIKIRKKS